MTNKHRDFWIVKGHSFGANYNVFTTLSMAELKVEEYKKRNVKGYDIFKLVTCEAYEAAIKRIEALKSVVEKLEKAIEYTKSNTWRMAAPYAHDFNVELESILQGDE